MPRKLSTFSTRLRLPCCRRATAKPGVAPNAAGSHELPHAVYLRCVHQQSCTKQPGLPSARRKRACDPTSTLGRSLTKAQRGRSSSISRRRHHAAVCRQAQQSGCMCASTVHAHAGGGATRGWPLPQVARAALRWPSWLVHDMHVRTATVACSSTLKPRAGTMNLLRGAALRCCAAHVQHSSTRAAHVHLPASAGRSRALRAPAHTTCCTMADR